MDKLSLVGPPDFSINLQTLYDIECWRDGVLIWSEHFHNLVTTVGRTRLLDACFRTGTIANGWSIGLIDNASFTSYNVVDTMASHIGWIEGVPYFEGIRQSYLPSTATSGSINNSASKAIFTINAVLTIRGAFLTDSALKGGTVGVLYGMGDFSIPRSVLNGDILNVQVTLTD